MYLKMINKRNYAAILHRDRYSEGFAAWVSSTYFIILCVYYYCCTMSSEKKKKKSSKERDHALHDATHGQFGEEPRPEPKPDMDEGMSYDNHRKDRMRAARKRSRSV
jgi:hypothetical protein